jgi:hypothetical protein
VTKETDRELLELAAKAAGWCDFDWLAGDGCMNVYDAQGKQSAWNPLTDDGDALRLAVKLGIKLELHPAWVYARAVITKYEYLQIEEGWANGFNDPCAATRRAIVRAAAEIGRAMP